MRFGVRAARYKRNVKKEKERERKRKKEKRREKPYRKRHKAKGMKTPRPKKASLLTGFLWLNHLAV